MLQVLNECKLYSFDLDTQKEILKNTVDSNLNKQYPIKISYQKAFLKSLMRKVNTEFYINDIKDTK
jgi:hypothetical protein